MSLCSGGPNPAASSSFGDEEEYEMVAVGRGTPAAAVAPPLANNNPRVVAFLYLTTVYSQLLGASKQTCTRICRIVGGTHYALIHPPATHPVGIALGASDDGNGKTGRIIKLNLKKLILYIAKEDARDNASVGAARCEKKKCCVEI